jgi:hypothetical protein
MWCGKFVLLLLAILNSQNAMFSRSKVSSTPAGNNLPGTGTNDNGYLTNEPNRTSPGRDGVVQGFVFTKWLRLHLVDLITMAIMGAIGLGVYYARELIFTSELSMRMR